MHIQPFTEQCIICLNRPPNIDGKGWSKEHVIPRALGGILTCDFVCQSCNSSMGAGFERLAKSDPSSRIAIQNLRPELPKLYSSMEDGQDHVLNLDVGQIVAQYRNGEIVGGYRKLPDGSLLVPSNNVEKHIQNKLQKEGLTPIQVQKGLEIYKNAKVGEKVELSPNISVIQHTPEYQGPKFDSSKSMNPLLPLKIAYEFAVLITGAPILERNFPFQKVRRCLIEQQLDETAFKIERLDASEYKPFYGIAFEGNSPVATFQIRLFGKIAYRVRFTGAAINLAPCIYTHNLKSGTEDLITKDTSISSEAVPN